MLEHRFANIWRLLSGVWFFMSAKLTVIFYIILCLEAGIALTFLPWAHPFGIGDWGDNYFLLYVVRKTGFEGLQYAVASGWVRGAVTGLGILNLAIAFWELTHFRQTVRALQGSAAKNAARPPVSDHLPDHGRRDDIRNDAAER
jgi:hypothetical protein